MSDWIKAMDKLRESQVETPPAGFKTRQQISTELNRSIPQCERIILAMVRAGIAERRMFRVETGAGVRSVPLYRLTNEKKK